MIRKLGGLRLALVALCLSGIQPAAAEFHVSPAGDDRAEGTQERPFASIPGGQESVLRVVAEGLTSDVTVLVHGGVYRIERALAFGPEDGGNEQFPVVYRATEGQRPIVSGGRLRYLPLAGQTPDQVSVVAPRAGQLLVVRGDLASKRPVRNLHFVGLTFEQFVIEQNTIFNIDGSPLRFHKGWINTVRDNHLETREGVPAVRYNDTREERITLQDNAVVSCRQIPADVLEQARRRTGPRPAHAARFEA